MSSSPFASLAISREAFGTLRGKPVHRFTLRNEVLEVQLTDFGARVLCLVAPDREGRLADVALGFKTLDEYVADRKTFMGAVVGRFANRIAGGRFELDGKPYQVAPNDGENALHGGEDGFDRRIWHAHEVPGGIEFSLVSPDGDQGFPGAVRIRVRYTLEGGTLRMEYAVRTDAPTVLNVTNHTYFNLAGESAGSVLDHELQVVANAYTPVDANLIPTGVLAPVGGTPFDFRTGHRIGKLIEEQDVQLQRARGYDHNWVLEGETDRIRLAAFVLEPTTGRTLTVKTSQPGVQFYSGNFLDGTLPNRHGGVYAQRSGFCLETQHFPDSPNQPKFASVVLRPDQQFHSTTEFTFGVQGKALQTGEAR